MAKFFTISEDYQRYGLDDSRCFVQRPTGEIELVITPKEWIITTEPRRWKVIRKVKWIYSSPLYGRKLYDRFLLHFSDKTIERSSLMLLVPFSSLSGLETEVISELTEKRHPKSVSGDFYGISEECSCIGACAPSEIAPDLIAYQEEPEGCYFIKQPQTEAECELATEAVLAAFVDSLRYSGTNPQIIRRMRKATRNLELDFCQGDLCDYPTEEIRK